MTNVFFFFFITHASGEGRARAPCANNIEPLAAQKIAALAPSWRLKLNGRVSAPQAKKIFKVCREGRREGRKVGKGEEGRRSSRTRCNALTRCFLG